MVAGVGSIGNVGSSSSVSSVQQQLTPQTKALLESLGVDTSSIQTEAQGQIALVQAQNSQQSNDAQKSQGSQQSHQGGGNREAFQSIKADAIDLAGKLGISVAQNSKLSDIMTSIAQALSTLQVQAGSDPQKLAQVSQYQSEFDAIGQSIQSLQSSIQPSQASSGSKQIQNSMACLAVYNMASIAIANSSAGNQTRH